MNRKEIIDNWVKALRSGDYEQGKSALKTSDGAYCCLGVLCDTMGIKEVFNWGEEVFEFDGSFLMLPPDVANELQINMCGGFDSAKLSVSTQGKCLHGRRDLAVLNDSGLTFEEIADLIEEIEDNDAWIYYEYDN